MASANKIIAFPGCEESLRVIEARKRAIDSEVAVGELFHLRGDSRREVVGMRVVRNSAGYEVTPSIVYELSIGGFSSSDTIIDSTNNQITLIFSRKALGRDTAREMQSLALGYNFAYNQLTSIK